MLTKVNNGSKAKDAQILVSGFWIVHNFLNPKFLSLQMHIVNITVTELTHKQKTKFLCSVVVIYGLFYVFNFWCFVSLLVFLNMMNLWWEKKKKWKESEKPTKAGNFELGKKYHIAKLPTPTLYINTLS